MGATDVNKIVVTWINEYNPRKFEFSANFVPLRLLPAPDEERRVPNQVSKCRDLKQTSDAKWSPLAVRGIRVFVRGFRVFVFGLAYQGNNNRSIFFI